MAFSPQIEQMLQTSVRVAQQKKQYDYYKGEISELENYLRIALSKMYDEDSVATMRFEYINLVKKIINQLAIIYKEPARRKIKVGGVYSKKHTDYYNSLLPLDVAKQDKIAHRLAKLHNTALPHYMYDEINKRFIQETLSSYFYEVISSDYRHANEVYYDREFVIDGKREIYEVHHTAEEIYILVDGKKMPLPNQTSMVNPYGTLDFGVFRLEEQEDFWGVGAETLVEGNEAINYYLTKLGRDDIILGTSGHLFGVNLAKGLGININNPNASLDTTSQTTPAIKRLKGGRGSIINVEHRTVDGSIAPDLKYISTNPQIESVLKAIDWKIKTIALEHGLNPNNFSTDSKVESGFSRVVARMEQMEVRSEDVIACRLYEQDRFAFIKTAVKNLGLEPFPDDAQLIVDFGETESSATVEDKWYNYKMELQHGIINLIDLMKNKNPELSDEDAKEITQNNLKEYRDFVKRYKDVNIDGRVSNKQGE